VTNKTFTLAILIESFSFRFFGHATRRGVTSERVGVFRVAIRLAARRSTAACQAFLSVDKRGQLTALTVRLALSEA
jgi:hypothetical protein